MFPFLGVLAGLVASLARPVLRGPKFIVHVLTVLHVGLHVRVEMAAGLSVLENCLGAEGTFFLISF